MTPTYARNQVEIALTYRSPTAAVTWATAPAEVRRGLPPPPERFEFSTDDCFEDALSGWAHRVAPILAIRQAAWHRSRPGK